MKKFLIRHFLILPIPYDKLLYVTSGPFSKTLGGNCYVAHFIKEWSSRSNIFFLKKNSELFLAILNYIAQLEATFTSLAYRVRRVRCKNAAEIICTEL